jgi:predicted phosphodiesterase
MPSPLRSLPSVGLSLFLLKTTLWADPPEELPFIEGSETLVVFPDTEGYAGRRPEIMNTMTRWTAEQIAKRNIQAVLHVGDVTNDNLAHEWNNARKAFDLIEDKIPYVLAAGNHDYDGTPGRLTHMNDVFKVETMQKWPGFGGVFEAGKLENHFQFVTLHGQKWLVLSLEMGPRKDVVAWANTILEKHRTTPAIILTHAYLCYDNLRYDHRRGKERATPYNFYGEGADGEMLWNQLIRRHPNTRLVICGHLSSAYVGYRKDEGDYGNVVHQMLVDYEKLRGGGMGFLRLLEFLPDRKTVQVRTYSPVTRGTQSPVTLGDEPIRSPELEVFQFTLQGPTRNKPMRVPEGARKPLTAPPVHRYSFDGKGGNGAPIADSIGKQHGSLHAPKGDALLNGKGQLVVSQTNGGHARLGPLVAGRKKVSVEVFFTPTAGQYSWAPVFQFSGEGNDWMWYCFRNLSVHRAELCDGGHNEDIQSKGLPVKPGQPLHVVLTYDQEAASADGAPVITAYLNGVRQGPMKTGIKLTELTLTQGMVGAFQGIFDEFRVYHRVLSHEEVRACLVAGPDRLPLRKR